MSGPKLVEFKIEKKPSARETLRAILAQIDAGEIPDIDIGAMVIYDKSSGLKTYSLGEDSTNLNTIAMLELGKTQIVDGIFGE